MDYKEMMRMAPKDCQPTEVKDFSQLKTEYAKQQGKSPKELTEEDDKTIMAANGLCDLDFLD